jgi:hypothetical protein
MVPEADEEGALVGRPQARLGLDARYVAEEPPAHQRGQIAHVCVRQTALW